MPLVSIFPSNTMHISYEPKQDPVVAWELISYRN